MNSWPHNLASTIINSYLDPQTAALHEESDRFAPLIGSGHDLPAADQLSRYGSMHKNQDDFIMLPVVDFAFKLLFGDAKRTERLKSLLASILKLPPEEFDDLIIMNPSLPADFAGDKSGILDVRAGLSDGRQINIEIQVLPFPMMPERTLFYWGKMYTQQAGEGDSYTEFKKCITINIMDYNFSLVKKVHSVYHITEDEDRSRLTDVLEVHFLDLEKLRSGLGIKGLDPSMLKWLRFLAAKRKEEFEMLAKEDKELNRAYERLQQVSADDEARLWYEARQKWLLDQRTLEVVARENAEKALEEGRAKGLAEGRTKGLAEGLAEGQAKAKTQIALNALKEGIDITLIVKLTGLSEAEIDKLTE
jgi:predicted transposase/invertase (TIGR01784 family)